MSGRLRRTRIYGANYNIGESYYKPTLDNLNRKQHEKFNEENDILGELKPKGYDSKLVHPSVTFQHETPGVPTVSFDYGRKEPSISVASVINEEIDEDILNSLKKIRELNTKPRLLNDISRDKESIQKKSLDVARFIKEKSTYDFDDFADDLNISTPNITQSSLSSTSASLRANATKERLANIEWEMSERTDKQIQREQRSANLKKILSEAGLSNGKVKKVTF